MRVAAVDMGATSVRVAVVDLTADGPDVEIVHRWAHGPDTRRDGSVRWRWTELVENVRRGLDRALDRGPLESIGIDGWGGDYGLLGDDGRLLSGSAQLPQRAHGLIGGRSPTSSERRRCTTARAFS
jgi:rhamnulokinase